MKITGRPGAYNQHDWRLAQYVNALPSATDQPVLLTVLADDRTVRQWVCARFSDDADFQPGDLVWWPTLQVLARLVVNPQDTSLLLAVPVTGFYEGANPLFRSSALLTPLAPGPRNVALGSLTLTPAQVNVPCGAGVLVKVSVADGYEVHPLPQDMRLALKVEQQPGFISIWRDPRHVAPRDEALLVVSAGPDLAVVEIKTQAACGQVYWPPSLPETLEVPCDGLPLPPPGGSDAPVFWGIDNAYDFDLKDGHIYRRSKHAALGLLTVSDSRGGTASSRLVGIPCVEALPPPLPEGYPPCQWPAHLSPTNEGYTLAAPTAATGTRHTTGKAYQEFLINDVGNDDLRPDQDQYVLMSRTDYVGVRGRLSLRLSLEGRILYPNLGGYQDLGVPAVAPLKNGDIVGFAVDLTQPHAPCWVHVNGKYLGGGNPVAGTSPTALLHYPGPLTPEAGGRLTVTLSRAFRYHPDGYAYFQEG